MKKFLIVIIYSIATISCRKHRTSSMYFVSPEEGVNISKGKTIDLKVHAAPEAFDSIRYFADTTYIGTKTDTMALPVSTDQFSLGTRIFTANVFKDGKATELSTNIVLLPEKAPLKYNYTVLNTFRHDTSSYTQGLEFHDGIFYESDGGRADLGGSSIRKVDVSGKVLKQVDISTDIFAEGLTLVDDKVIQLTWQNGFGIVYDKALNKLKEFPYQASREGWGLAFDGKRILKSDGSNRIYFLNKDSYAEEGYIEVYDNKGMVDQLNELEYIDGKLYANVYQTDRIVVIDPRSGAVEAAIDLSRLYPETERNPEADVLNGIAWDAAGKRLFVTGKKWDKLFQISLAKGE